MGKKIDRFAITASLAIFLFFYFHESFSSILLSVILAVLSCILISRVFCKIKMFVVNTPWHKRLQLHKNAKSALMHVACMDKKEALMHINALLKTCYQNHALVELEQLHPSLQLSPEHVFNLWRTHRELKELVICTTGICSSETRRLAESMNQPRLAIVDAPMLSRLISEHPDGFYPIGEEKKRPRLHVKQLAALFFNRRNAPRCILFSFSMLVMYVFSGSIFYLIFSLLLLFIALSSFHRPVHPTKLF